VARPRVAAWTVYLLLALGLAGPWYLAMAATDPTFLGYFFWYQNALRYVAAFDHQEPFWFYLPGLLLGMLPWTLLLPALLKFLSRRSAKTAMRRPAELGFFLLAFVWSVAFYSAAGCKRTSYILPAMPLLALALGCYLDAVLPREKLWQARTVLRFPSALAYRATLLVLTLAAGGGLLAVFAGLSQPSYGLLLTSLAALVLALVLYQRRGRRAAASWALCGAVTFTVLFAGVHLLLPSYARRFSLRGQVRPHIALGRDPQVPVMCYPHRWDSVSFYLRRNDVRVYTPERRQRLMADLAAQPQALVFVKSDHSYQDLLRDLPPMLEFMPRGRRGTVVVGLVRYRQELPSSVLARR
jgi:dolichol-phosphate mannosyltransferase